MGKSCPRVLKEGEDGGNSRRRGRGREGLRNCLQDMEGGSVIACKIGRGVE